MALHAASTFSSFNFPTSHVQALLHCHCPHMASHQSWLSAVVTCGGAWSSEQFISAGSLFLLSGTTH